MAKEGVKYKMIAIGGSAGSLNVMLDIISSLPPNTGASFVVIVHRKNSGDSILTDLIAAKTQMDVKEVEDKEPIVENTVYLAPSDYHLLTENEHSFSLDSSEKVHYSRPSIDVTFESIAEIFREGSIGILLSGANADGAEGLAKIRQFGGLAIVQNPASAEVSYMPEQAIQKNAADKILKPEEIVTLIVEMLSVKS